MIKKGKVCILGTGNMGTALAYLVSLNNYKVMMWGIDKEAIDNINNFNENKKFLPGIILNNKISATLKIEAAIKDSEIIIIALPVQVIDSVLNQALPFLNKKQIILSSSKGIEIKRGLTVTKIIKNKLPRLWHFNVAVLMGPLFASEISTGIPTVGLFACHKIEVFKKLKKVFKTPSFYVHYSNDVDGAELGGALKNVYAIILGTCDGLGYGWNTKSAALTTAISEMSTVGSYLGGKRETFYGLAGLGDLMTTAFGEKSRNRRFGEKVCSGKSIEEVLKEIGQVVEGVSTVKILKKILKNSKINTPLLNSVFSLVKGNKNPCQLMHKILDK